MARACRNLACLLLRASEGLPDPIPLGIKTLRSPTAPAIPPRAHLPALDGLRGLAVLAVMFYHFNLIIDMTYAAFDGIPAALARSGWCGVDLFFVLSGFLITG